jgi:hypothetical protein
MLRLLFSCSASQEKTNMWRWWKWKLLLPCRNDMPSAAAHWTLNLSTTQSGHDLLTTHADRSAQNDSTPPPKRHPFPLFFGVKTNRLPFHLLCRRRVGRVATGHFVYHQTHTGPRTKYTKIKWVPQRRKMRRDEQPVAGSFQGPDILAAYGFDICPFYFVLTHPLPLSIRPNASVNSFLFITYRSDFC